MKQLLSVMLVCTLASFNFPASQKTDTQQPVKINFSTYSVWYINYGGAGSDLTVSIGPNQWVTPSEEGTQFLGSAEEGSYGLSITKNTPDSTPRYVQLEDPFYEGTPPFYYFYWSTGDFYGSFNINSTFNEISVGWL